MKPTFKSKPVVSKSKPAAVLPPVPETIRVTFSTPGVRWASDKSPAVKATLAYLMKKYRLPSPGTVFTFGTGYFDKRSTITCDVPSTSLLPALVYGHRKNGHASTSIGAWLLDTEVK